MPLTVNSEMPSHVGASATAQASGWAPTFVNTAGTVLYAFLQIDIGAGSGPPTGVALTYAGAGMTLLGSRSANGNAKGWIGLFRKTTPATGSNSFAATWTGGAATVTIEAISFTGNATTPDSGTANVMDDATVFSGNSAPLSISVTGTTSGSVVIAGFAYGDSGLTGGTGSPSGIKTANIEVASDSYTNNTFAEYTTSSGGTVASTLSLTNDTSYAAVAIEVLSQQGSPSVSPSVSPSSSVSSSASPSTAPPAFVERTVFVYID